MKKHIEKYLESAGNKTEAINEIRSILHKYSPIKHAPVDYVKLIPIEKIKPNDYNPNNVAKVEMGLLQKSIEHDGYTQPIVTIYDKEKDKYIIIDGFHRYFIMKTNKRLREQYNGLLPITVIDKDVNDRMASTVRHNRARGKHQINGMSNMVYKMLDNGMTEEEVCNELGMEPEEILRLKHITGFSKLFENTEYKKAWVTKRQILLKKQDR